MPVGLRCRRSDFLLTELLFTHGLNFKDIERRPPFVIIDRTQFNPDSQSRRLQRAAFDRYAEDHSVAPLVQKLGVVSSTTGMFFSSARERETYFAELEAEALSCPAWRPRQSIWVDSAKSFTDQAEWHDSFGELKWQPNGSLAGEPGERASLHSRNLVLMQLYEILGYVSTPQFLASVQKAARDLGYEFPLQRKYAAPELPREPIPTTLLVDPEKIAEHERFVRERKASLDVLETQLVREAFHLPHRGQNETKLAEWYLTSLAQGASDELTSHFLATLSRFIDYEKLSLEAGGNLLALVMAKAKGDEFAWETFLYWLSPSSPLLDAYATRFKNTDIFAYADFQRMTNASCAQWLAGQ